MPRSRLLGLPDELFIKILLCLSYRDILRCSETCKLLYAVVGSSVALEYLLELAKSGWEDDGIENQSSNVAERLELLKQTRSRRRQFEPVLVNDITIVDRPSSKFSLADGMYATVEALNATAARFRLYDITKTSDSPSITTTLDFRPLSLAIAPAQDLVVLTERLLDNDLDEITLRIHLRALSSGAVSAHPGALQPVLQWSNTYRDLGINLELAIAGNVLALYNAHASFVRVHRWSSGKLLAAWSEHEETSSFTLVSPTCFVVGITSSPAALAVSALPNDDSKATLTSSSVAKASVMLSFPLTTPGGFNGLYCHSTGSGSSLGGFLRPKSCLTALTLTFDDFGAGASDVHIHCVIRTELFEEILVASGSGRTTSKRIPWTSWGPQNVRMLDLPIASTHRQCATHSSRTVYQKTRVRSSVDEVGRQPAAYYIVDIADTRDVNFRHAIQSGEAPLGPRVQRAMMPDAEDIALPGLWLSPTRTTLPCFVVETRLEGFDYDRVMLDDTRIVCTRREAGDYRRLFHVYQL